MSKKSMLFFEGKSVLKSANEKKKRLCSALQELKARRPVKSNLGLHTLNCNRLPFYAEKMT